MHSPFPAFISLFLVAFFVIFGIVVVGIFLNVIKGVSQWSSNNAQPVQTDDAEIVAKRTEVSGGEKSTSTTYFATFELSGSLRKELEISGRDFGQFAEGDTGSLTHQGTRFRGFSRSARPVQPPPEPVSVWSCCRAHPSP